MFKEDLDGTPGIALVPYKQAARNKQYRQSI